MTGYDVKALGGDRYRISLQFKCVKPIKKNWARILHLQPATLAGLETAAERQVGLKNWDGMIEPPTSTWQPGRTYNTAVEGALPQAGAP